MNFGSDNMAGASAPVLNAVLAANEGSVASYGADPWCEQARTHLSTIFDHDVQVFFASTGTVANSLALSALVPPWGAVLCHRQAHVLMDESSAPEFFTGGARLLTLPGNQGKVTVASLHRGLRVAPHAPHNVVPRALTLTQANECGLVYTPAELRALGDAARQHGLKIHMDGARFANALVALGCHPADITWRAGVDVLCLGASKNGALMAEAIVFFDPELATDFSYRLKRAGQMAAKGRFYGAQFTGWLADGHWLELARHANTMAGRLSAGLVQVPGVELVWPTEANEVFTLMPALLAERLREEGAVFYDWSPDALPDGLDIAPDQAFARWVCSFNTKQEEIDELLARSV
jgi:threonine aldolase